MNQFTLKPGKPEAWIAEITDPETRSKYAKVFPSGEIPILGPLPVRAFLDGIGETLIYKMDLDRISPKQQLAIAWILAVQLGAPPEEIMQQMHTIGLPVQAQKLAPPELGSYLYNN